MSVSETSSPGLLKTAPWPLAGLLIVVGIGASVVAAQLNVTGLLVIAGVGVLAVGFIGIRDRRLFVLVLLVLTLQFLLHKKFGSLDKVVNSGAPVIYISSIYVWVLLLYGLWMAEGTIGADLLAGLRNPVLLLPVLVAVPALLSLLAATDLQLALAELFRMGWMYALFLYVALRVRRRHEVAAVVWSLLAIAVIQCLVSVAQWKTGSSLGLGFLGEQGNLDVRALDQGAEVPRPSGTVVHPDFLAALVAPIGLIALCLGIRMPPGGLKWAALVCCPIAFAPLLLAQTRAALAGAVVAMVLVVLAYLQSRRLRPAVVLAAVGVGGLGALLFWSQLQAKLFENLGTAHFQEEVQSRVELNQIALAMILDHPILGVGINNFQAAMGLYDHYGALFAGNPVHNLYLLVCAETGFAGLALLVVMGLALLVTACRAVASSDPLVAAVGGGVAAALAFYAVEELAAFSAREEMPFALLAILGGLAVAVRRLEQSPASTGVAGA